MPWLEPVTSARLPVRSKIPSVAMTSLPCFARLNAAIAGARNLDSGEACLAAERLLVGGR